MCASREDREIEGLCAQLFDMDPSVRRHASKKLSQFSLPHTAGHLAEALKDSDIFVKNYAQDGLVSIGGPAIKPLMALLELPQAPFRSYAMNCVQKISLKRNADLDSPEAIVKFLLDEDSEVRQITYVLLSDNQNEASANSIWRIAIDTTLPKQTRDIAAELLTKFTFPSLVPRLIPFIHDTTADSLSRRYAANLISLYAEEQSYELFYGMIEDEVPYIRACAISAIGKKGDPNNQSLLISKLEDTDQEVREAAATALGEMGNKEVIVVLQQASRDREKGIYYACKVAIERLNERLNS